MQKWNREMRKYTPYEVPGNWHCPLTCNDMQELVNCASCGKKLLYGDTFTSMEIHDDIGVGYGVCGECYSEELLRRREREGEYRNKLYVDVKRSHTEEEG